MFLETGAIIPDIPGVKNLGKPPFPTSIHNMLVTTNQTR
jgi:hypothetical protein